MRTPYNLTPATDPMEFLSLRYNRDVIKEASIRVNHLLQMPRGERTCPLQSALYRRAGVRIVGRYEMASHDPVTGEP